jgi:hypothetical protein
MSYLLKYDIHNWFQLKMCSVWKHKTVYIEQCPVDLISKSIVQSDPGLELACQRAFGSLLSADMSSLSLTASRCHRCLCVLSLHPWNLLRPRWLSFITHRCSEFFRFNLILSIAIKRESAYSYLKSRRHIV